MIKLLTVVGARPQFIKAAVLSRLIRSAGYNDVFSEVLLHTGQHYDDNMSNIFFQEMDIPVPNINLAISGGGHGEMTGKMLSGIEKILEKNIPDLVVVYGDTNSTLAGALVASKLCIPIAHIEAGLRSFNMNMPEEQNRIIADNLSSLLFCPTEHALDNLAKEGFPKPIVDGHHQVIENVGDIMFDAALYYKKIVDNLPKNKKIHNRLNLPPDFFLLTIHRAENTNTSERFINILEALNGLPDKKIVFPVHPRTKAIIKKLGIKIKEHIMLIDPVGYFEMLDLEQSSYAIITDSGGVQKEAFFFRKPCITLREQTEWQETVDSGWNVLVGADPKMIKEAVNNISTPSTHTDFYGDGKSGERILSRIKTYFL